MRFALWTLGTCIVGVFETLQGVCVGGGCLCSISRQNNQPCSVKVIFKISMFPVPQNYLSLLPLKYLPMFFSLKIKGHVSIFPKKAFLVCAFPPPLIFMKLCLHFLHVCGLDIILKLLFMTLYIL